MKFKKTAFIPICIILALGIAVLSISWIYYPKHIDENKVKIDVVLPSNGDSKKIKIDISNNCRFPILLLNSSYNGNSKTFEMNLPTGYMSIDSGKHGYLDDEFKVLKNVDMEDLLEIIEASDLQFEFIPDVADTENAKTVRIKPNCYIE